MLLGPLHPLSELPGIFFSLPPSPTISLLFILQVLAQASPGILPWPQMRSYSVQGTLFLPAEVLTQFVMIDPLTLGSENQCLILPRDPKIHKHKASAPLLKFLFTMNGTGPSPSRELSKWHFVKCQSFRRLDRKEGWALKNWCFQIVVLEKTLESPLDCKDIKPVNPRGNQPWIFIGRTDAEAEAPILWPPDGEELILYKSPWCWERLKAKGEEDGRGWDGWMASPPQWTWVWVNSGR